MRTLLVPFLVPAIALAAAGGTPLSLPHSGFVLDASDAPVTNGSVAATFRLYDRADAAGQTLEWEATCNLAIAKGYYAVVLGAAPCAGDGLDTADFAGGARYLEIALAGATLTPRTLLAPLPIAATALDSAKLGGVPASSFVQKDGTGRLPAIDGSQLTNLSAGGDLAGTLAGATVARLQGRAVANVDPTDAQVLGWNQALTRWQPIDRGVTSLVAGAGLTGGTITSTGTLAVNAGTGANQIVQLDASSRLPAVSGAQLTNLNGGAIASGTVADARLSSNVALLNGTQTFSGTNTFGTLNAASISATGGVKAGTVADAACGSGSGAGTFRWRAPNAEVCDGSAWRTLAYLTGDGSSASTAAASCLALRQQGFTTDKVYWIAPSGQTAYQVWCDMTTDGGGWTYVAESGRSTTNTADTFIESNAGYHRYIYDLKGLRYGEVLAKRPAGYYWCNSWGDCGTYWGPNSYVSMGLAYDTNTYSYANGQFSPYSWIQQPYSIKTSCSSCWTANNTTASAVTITTLDGATGAVVKLVPPVQNNSYLELENFDAFTGQSGGCNCAGGKQGTHQVFVR